MSAEQILGNAEREYENNVHAVNEILPTTIKRRTETLQTLQRALMEPAKVCVCVCVFTHAPTAICGPPAHGTPRVNTAHLVPSTG